MLQHALRAYLELGVEIYVQIHESTKGRGGMSRWKALKRVIDFVDVPSADAAVVHDLAEAIADLCALVDDGFKNSWIRSAHVQKMRPQAANQPLEEDLEDSSADERVEKANNSVVHVPEAADANLHDEKDGNWDQSTEHGSRPDGNDLVARRVRELGVDNITALKKQRKGTRGSRMSFVDAQSQSAHEDHGQDVRPGHLEPLSKARTAVEVAWVVDDLVSKGVVASPLVALFRSQCAMSVSSSCVVASRVHRSWCSVDARGACVGGALTVAAEEVHCGYGVERMEDGGWRTR